MTVQGGVLCPHPSTIPAHLSPAATVDEASDMHLEARTAAQAGEMDRIMRVSLAEADTFIVTDRTIHMAASDDFIDQPGIYTFTVWANDTVFGQHVMFVN